MNSVASKIVTLLHNNTELHQDLLNAIVVYCNDSGESFSYTVS